MNTVKTVLTVVLLGAGVYAVSVWLQQQRKTAEDDGSAAAWATPAQLAVGPPADPSLAGAPTVSLGATMPDLSLAAPGAGVAASPSEPQAAIPLPAESPAMQPYPSTAPAAGLAVPVPPTATDARPNAAAPPPGGMTAPADCPEFEQTLAAVQPALQQGQLADSLLSLSAWYGDPRLSPAQTERLESLLAQLAGTAIYAREYPLEPDYVVQPGDALDAIAAAYGVEWPLLAKINGLTDPRQLAPGQQLKVVRGPFHALVDLSDYRLTLFVAGRYAGRFRIGLGQDFPQQEGQYRVRDKTIHPSAAAPGAAASEPLNPYGHYWISLDGPLGIHGTSDPQRVGTTQGPGYICLNHVDMADVFDILTLASTVTVRR